MARPKNTPARDRNIRKALALAEQGVGQREIGRRLGVNEASVRHYLRRYDSSNDAVNDANNGRHAVHFSSETDEWTTPSTIIEVVQQIFRHGIDLDPCADTNKTVPATHHFTVDMDGLNGHWPGRVYMNPPYGRSIDDWVTKLCEEIDHDCISEAIALLPARTDTRWFRRLDAFPKCFIHGRLKFGGADNGAPFPSVLAYKGLHDERFIAITSTIGTVYRPLVGMEGRDELLQMREPVETIIIST